MEAIIDWSAQGVKLSELWWHRTSGFSVKCSKRSSGILNSNLGKIYGRFCVKIEIKTKQWNQNKTIEWKAKVLQSINPLAHTGKYTTDYDNLPERYMIKKTTQVEWKSPNNPRYNETFEWGRWTPEIRWERKRVSCHHRDLKDYYMYARLKHLKEAHQTFQC